MLDIISIAIVPFIVFTVLVHGYVKGIDIYSAFIEGGAKEGLKTAINIMPYLIAIFIAVGIFRGSTALDMFIQLLSPITNLLGIPPNEIAPLALIRPVSGSGALGVIKDIMVNHGPRFLFRKSSCNHDGIFRDYILHCNPLLWFHRSKRLWPYSKSSFNILYTIHIYNHIHIWNNI